MRFAAAFLIAAGWMAHGQHVGFGVIGGVPFTDAFNAATGSTGLNNFVQYQVDTGRYAIGPMIELRLPVVSVEADALFRPVSVKQQATATAAAQSTGAGWAEIPILLKVHVPAPIVKPFVGAGPTFRWFPGNASELTSVSRGGFSIGAGVNVHAVFLHIEPSLRYTHWGAGPFRASGGAVLLQANQNQFEFLVSISH